MKLSRAQRRKLQQLAEKVVKVTDADRAFFERRPDRKHRVRLASKVELEQFGIMMVIGDTTPPPGYEHFVVVKSVSPGVRLRRPLTSRVGNDTDVSEAEAKWLYQTTLSDREREIEAAMMAEAGR